MATRHQVRQVIVSLLYTYEMKTNSDEFLNEFLEKYKIRNERKTMAINTLNAVLENKDEIDQLLQENLKDGDIQKVGLVEKCILRLGIYEIKFTDIQKAVAINEAVELAKELASDSSPKFINAILDKIVD